MTKPTHHSKLGFYYLCFLGFLLIPLYGTTQLTYKESEAGIQIKEGAENVLFYQKQTKSRNEEFSRNNYIHPLYGIDGSVLTEDFPEDHPHHRGVFWAWHQVVIGDRKLGDSWACKDFIWNIKNIEISRSGENLNLMVSTHWQSPKWISPEGTQKPFLLENTKISIYPRKDNYRIVRFEIALLALEKNLKIGGSEDEKGYGGFSVRLQLPEDIRFSSIEGSVAAKNTAVEGGKWMNVFGSFTNKNNRSGIAIFSHQDALEDKEKWILREKESMQNCVFPGRKSVTVSTTNPTILKYSLLIYEGEMTGSEIQKIYKELK
ncbi:MAG: PmoA family protein [Flavobacteriaceae bacterium]|nr:MAG: PmoA family protein [Flavobacteriaceae bacterium]